MATHCPICKTLLRGRTDKLFCSAKCRSIHHYQLKKELIAETARIDRLLHKNYLIIRALIPDGKSKVKISVSKLEEKNFQFQYLTGYTNKNKQQVCHFIYDFAWYKLNEKELILIKR